MAQWLALSITTVGGIIMFSVLWGKMDQRQSNSEKRIDALEEDSQSPAERKAVADMFDNRFKSHEDLDNVRFENLQESIHNKLDDILSAVKK